jgi:L-fuconolactonase
VIVDAQVHIFEANQPGRPWAGGGHSLRPELTTEQLLVMMDEAGVDEAVLVSAWSNYRFDPSYALQAADAHPERFTVVAPVDPDRPDMDEFVSHWKTLPNTVGLRQMLLAEAEAERTGVGGDSLLAAAERHGVPLCVEARGKVARIAPMAAAHPELRLVVDHLGLIDGFHDLPVLLSLAEYPNVYVKATGVPTLSAEPYPFADIWPALEQIFEAFTLQRVMWGTDWTRTTDVLSMRESVTSFTESGRLSAGDREQLMATTAKSVFRRF